VGPERPGISLLRVDYHHGIRQGVQHLAVLGHREIAFISGPRRLHSAQSRQKAFTGSLEECGIRLNPAWIVEGDHTMEGGIDAMGRLLQGRVPTAVMCSNDMTAIGALRVLAKAGLRVPDDMSVIGFDDIHLAEFVYPPLTTVRMSRHDLARAAFSALRSHVEPMHARAKKTWPIPTKLTVRQSTGYPPGTALSKVKRPRKNVQE
jgi:LacI family transcriptional regulator